MNGALGVLLYQTRKHGPFDKLRANGAGGQGNHEGCPYSTCHPVSSMYKGERGVAAPLHRVGGAGEADA